MKDLNIVFTLPRDELEALSYEWFPDHCENLNALVEYVSEHKEVSKVNVVLYSDEE